MTLGPIMLDLEGQALGPEDRELLAHPLVGGVILFARNYASPEQLTALVRDIHGIRSPELLVAVDQEGGRVQRFSEGFTRLPPMHLLGRQYDLDREHGRELAQASGWLMAAELRATGVDLSFAPVLDLDWGLSEVIGDRAIHRNPEAVIDLARAYMRGMERAGMAATGKHFPGHGAVAADSHLTLPVDRRGFADIQEDLLPFERLIGTGLKSIMAAHVVYPEVDPQPASFSPRWLQDILRGDLDFRGVVFSDDLCMAGAAAVAESVPERAGLALDAGCDMVLICNDRSAALETIEALKAYLNPVSQFHLIRMHGGPLADRGDLMASDDWQAATRLIGTAEELPQLQLGSPDRA